MAVSMSAGRYVRWPTIVSSLNITAWRSTAVGCAVRAHDGDGAPGWTSLVSMPATGAAAAASKTTDARRPSVVRATSSTGAAASSSSKPSWLGDGASGR